MDYKIKTAKVIKTQFTSNDPLLNTVYSITNIIGKKGGDVFVHLKGWVSKEAKDANKTPLENVPVLKLNWQKVINLILKAIKDYHKGISEEIEEQMILTELWPEDQSSVGERVFLYWENYGKLSIDSLTAMPGYIKANVPYFYNEHGIYLYATFVNANRTALINNDAIFQLKSEYDLL